MKTYIALPMIVIFATGCHGNTFTTSSSLNSRDYISPSLVEDPPTQYTLSQTTSSSSSDISDIGAAETLVLLSAVHSKMSPALLDLPLEHSSVSEHVSALHEIVSPTTPNPTVSPTLGEHFYFAPDDRIKFLDTNVWCSSRIESMPVSFRSIEFPYFYQLETSLGRSDGAILHRIECALLAAFAKDILTCANEENEDIMHLLGSGGADQARVVEAYSFPKDTISDENSCPSNTHAHSCSVVKGKIILIIEGGDKAKDDAILLKAQSTVNLTFLILNGQGMNRVRYIGNGPLSLPSIDKLSTDTQTTENDMLTTVFSALLLVISISVSAAAILALIAFVCIHVSEKDENNDRSMGEDEESSGVPSTIDMTLSSSSDDMDKIGGGALPYQRGCDHSHTTQLIFADEGHRSALTRFGALSSKSIVLSSSRLSRLSRVPEEARVCNFVCEDNSV